MPVKDVKTPDRYSHSRKRPLRIQFLLDNSPRATKISDGDILAQAGVGITRACPVCGSASNDGLPGRGTDDFGTCIARIPIGELDHRAYVAARR